MNTSNTSSHIEYVLVTAARNEEAFIEKTIESVIHQTILPMKWVIVDDGSTDGTAEVIRRYLPEYRWMQMVQMPQRRREDRSFGAKVHSFDAGLPRVKHLSSWPVFAGSLIRRGRNSFQGRRL